MSPCGGIGRRSRLKICHSQGCEGSIPFVGTTAKPLQFVRVFCFYHLLFITDQIKKVRIFGKLSIQFRHVAAVFTLAAGTYALGTTKRSQKLFLGHLILQQ